MGGGGGGSLVPRPHFSRAPAGKKLSGHETRGGGGGGGGTTHQDCSQGGNAPQENKLLGDRI